MKDILANRHLLTYLAFLWLTYAACSIDQNIRDVYLTNELKFSKESLSFVKMISAPANIACSIISSYLSSEKPFKYIFYTTIACILVSSYSVLVMCYNFPKDEQE